MTIKQETYNSSTCGPLPLSQYGKDLMQELGVAVKEFEESCGLIPYARVSEAHAEIVRYMSDLEQLQNALQKVIDIHKPFLWLSNATDKDLHEEVARRARKAETERFENIRKAEETHKAAKAAEESDRVRRDVWAEQQDAIKRKHMEVAVALGVAVGRVVESAVRDAVEQCMQETRYWL